MSTLATFLIPNGLYYDATFNFDTRKTVFDK
jgi:hypothetical protein